MTFFPLIQTSGLANEEITKIETQIQEFINSEDLVEIYADHQIKDGQITFGISYICSNFTPDIEYCGDCQVEKEEFNTFLKENQAIIKQIQKLYKQLIFNKN